MTKQEIERAIENGESVWGVYKNLSGIYEIKTSDFEYVNNKTLLWGKEFYCNIRDLFKTKADAEHYLHHANITRTETLPFLTWEKFLEKKDIRFYTKDGDEVRLYITDDGNKIYVIEFKPYGYLGKWNATEAKFYKAYDECVRLFKGEE